MTVTFERESQQTVIQETLTGSFRDGTLFLTGVNYSYVQQGSSGRYNLDSFELKPENDGRKLVGKVILRNGVQDMEFKRIQNPPKTLIKSL
jgi:hypothetical protein